MTCYRFFHPRHEGIWSSIRRTHPLIGYALQAGSRGSVRYGMLLHTGRIVFVAGLLSGTTACVPVPSPFGDWDTVQATATLPLPPGARTVPPTPTQETVLPRAITGTGSLPPGPGGALQRVPDILARGRLIVGVEANQHLLSFRDPATGALRGFDIDIAHEIARDIFGDPSRVEFRFVNAAQRIPALDQRRVDMVVRTVTITPEREHTLLFSTPYFHTTVRLMVPVDSSIQHPRDTAGHTICVADGSTSLRRAQVLAPKATLLLVRRWADCLVAMQQQQADAVLSDDTVLAGLAAQDPHMHIVGPPLGEGYYGVAVARPTPTYDTTGIVRQVNATIERIRTDGTWYTRARYWFGNYGLSLTPPALSYRPEGPIPSPAGQSSHATAAE